MLISAIAIIKIHSWIKNLVKNNDFGSNIIIYRQIRLIKKSIELKWNRK